MSQASNVSNHNHAVRLTSPYSLHPPHNPSLHTPNPPHPIEERAVDLCAKNGTTGNLTRSTTLNYPFAAYALHNSASKTRLQLDYRPPAGIGPPILNIIADEQLEFELTNRIVKIITSGCNSAEYILTTDYDRVPSKLRSSRSRKRRSTIGQSPSRSSITRRRGTGWAWRRG